MIAETMRDFKPVKNHRWFLSLVLNQIDKLLEVITTYVMGAKSFPSRSREMISF